MRRFSIQLIGTLFTLTTIGQGSLIIQTDKSCNLDLIGFRGFEHFSISEKSFIEGQLEVIDNKGYIGLALMVFDGGQSYPVLINGDYIGVKFHDHAYPPTISGSPENEWLYKILLHQQNIYNDLNSSENTADSYTKNDPLQGAMHGARDQTEERKSEIDKEISVSNYSIAGTLLRARLLMESTYSVRTKESLEEKKAEFLDFINKNIGRLYYSDMLMELAKQYMMMNEYAPFSQPEFEYTIATDPKRWIETLDELIAPEDVLAFFTRFYYDRGMVGYASIVMNSQPSLVFTMDSKPINKELTDVLQGINITDKIGVTQGRMDSYNGINVIALVSDADVFSKVETIALARRLDSDKKNSRVIVFPVDGKLDYCYAINNQLSGNLYYPENSDALKLFDSESLHLPCFILMDGNTCIGQYQKKEDVINLLPEETKWVWQ